MTDYFQDPDDCYREGPPHCKTCVCREEIRRRTRVRIASPKMRPTTYIPERDTFRRCQVPEDEWKPRDTRRCAPVYRSVSPPPAKDEKEHKFAVLENWFRRFDLDGNGLLDVYELRRLLNYLGVQTDQEYAKDLIDRADRDADGMLSFSEFLHMWNEVAQDDIDLRKIIKEHGLLPDIPCKRPKHPLKLATNKHLHTQAKETLRHKLALSKECTCGTLRKPQVIQRERPVDIEIRKVKHPPAVYRTCSDTIPIMSCNR